MFCQYQYYRLWTERLQAAVDHKTKCSKRSWRDKLLRRNRCPYTGTTVIEKISWMGEARVYQAEDQAGEEGDTAEREEGDGRLTSRPREQEDSELNRARSLGLRDRVKRIFKR